MQDTGIHKNKFSFWLSSLPAGSKGEFNEIILFTPEEIQVATGLDHSALILFALLAGDDYESGGLKGCGQVTAHQLARSGLGTSVVEQVQEPAVWRDHVQSHPPCGLPRRMCSLLTQMPTDFPSGRVLDWYNHPVTSYSNSNNTEYLHNWRMVEEPYIKELAQLCGDSLGWLGAVGSSKPL